VTVSGNDGAAAKPKRARRKLETEASSESGYSTYRSITETAEGGLEIEGQSLWPAGDEDGEYEFARSIAPADVALLRVALGITADVDLIASLVELFGPLVGLTDRLEQVIQDNKIASSFWSS
jgi:hypothetical protein